MRRMEKEVSRERGGERRGWVGLGGVRESGTASSFSSTHSRRDTHTQTLLLLLLLLSKHTLPCNPPASTHTPSLPTDTAIATSPAAAPAVADEDESS